MKRFWHIFRIWFIVLSAVWGYANLPRDGGTLKSFLEWAGFPWSFAFWDDGQLRWFDSRALAADVAVGFFAAFVLAFICAWSRCRFVARSAEE